jgi:hypothetical protein
MSVFFELAAQRYHEVREAYELYRENQYARALNDLGGVLLNRDGLARGVDTYSLFIGSQARAERWASEELIEWWRRNGRMTYRDFELQHVDVPSLLAA